MWRGYYALALLVNLSIRQYSVSRWRTPWPPCWQDPAESRSVTRATIVLCSGQGDPLRKGKTYASEDRGGIYRLAWDTCCSAFASRQVLYERYFGGDALRTALILYNFYDRKPMTAWVQRFLEQE